MYRRVVWWVITMCTDVIKFKSNYKSQRSKTDWVWRFFSDFIHFKWIEKM